MRKQWNKWSLLLALFGSSLSLLSGCGNKEKEEESINEEEAITKILEASSPSANVHVGEYEHLTSEGTTPVDANTSTYGSSTILDMPKDEAIHVIYDNSENRTLQSISCLLTNIVEANDEVGIISIQDRGGAYLNNLLSSNGEKILVSAPGGFEYGEVYQIEINDAPYLSFEGKDPQIRKLTIEIEDDPKEAKTYDEKKLNSAVVKIDRSKVSNKKVNKENETYTFVYDGLFPEMEKETIFFASIEDQEDDRQDFYGSFLSKTNNGNTETITYTTPDMADIYSSFRMKGEKEADLSDAEVLLNSEFAIAQFKQSSLARGLVRNLLSLNPDTIKTVIEALRHLNINIDINLVGNRVSMKIILKLSSVKIKENHYIGLEIGHETITDYTFDFDLKLNYKWIFPCGVDYKVKCVEDSQDIWYFRFLYDHQPISDLSPEDSDYTKKLEDDILKSMNGDSSYTGELLEEDRGEVSTSGTRSTFPLISVDFHYLTPLQIRFKLDFYFDLGFQALGLIKYESRSTKVDFNFTNMGGASQDTLKQVKESSNLVVNVGGNFHAEVGLRISLGLSLLGLYDYLHVEGYAEGYVNFSASGMAVMDIDFGTGEFSGYYSIDLNLSIGLRAGLNVKAIIITTNLQKTWSLYLFRLKFDNPMQHWSERAETTIDMDKETLKLDDTAVLWIKYFDPLTLSIKEKQYKANDQFSLLSGLMIEKEVQELTSGHTFRYTVEDPSLLEVSKDGVIHVKDGTSAAFTTHITIHVPSLVGFIEDRTITINYSASDIKDIYAGDKLIGQYRPSYSFVLPEADKIRGKEFEYYSYKGTRYYVGDQFKVPNESVVLEMHYRNLPTYKIYFYDGATNLVAIDEVYEGEAAHEPSPEIRDRYTDEGWAFCYWNRSFDNVRQELHVSGCYFRVN